MLDIYDVKMETTSFWTGHKKAIIDSFYRPIALPRPEFTIFANYIRTKLGDNNACSDNLGTCAVAKKCKDIIGLLPPIRVQFSDNYTFSVMPADYLYDTTVSGANVCGFDI